MIPYIALFSWPLISIAFFKRYSAPTAVLVTILAGYLLLPEKTSVDLPLLPELDKTNVSALTALVLATLLAGRNGAAAKVLPGIMSQLWSMRLLIGVLVFGTFMTIFTNGEALHYGPRVLPGLRPYDAFSFILSALMFLLPMLLARKYLASPQAHRIILLTLCLAGLAYSLLVLFELRMSPQLHQWIYGFFPHSWIQHVRGGWRPIVFLGHGLLLGIFLSATVLAALALSRAWAGYRVLFALAGFWLLIILLLSKNLGAFLITLVLIPCVLFLTVRMQLVVAAAVTAVFLSYPVVRDSKLIPIDAVVEFAREINPDRAASLLFRLENEDVLLDKARERPVFGWGDWGRWRIYRETDGADITISDGEWVITLGIGGWVGYVARFGLVCAPIFLLLFRQRRIGVGPETAALAVILAGNMIDCIPNSSMTPVTAILAGALWGRTELGAARASAPAAARSPEPLEPVERKAVLEAVSPYTRQTQRIDRVRRSARK